MNRSLPDKPTEEKGEFGPLLRLSLPIILVNVSYNLMGTVDTALAGRMSELVQGATGLGNILFFFGTALGMGVVLGVDPVASQAFGAGRARRARQGMWQGIRAGALLFLPVAAVVFGLGQNLEFFGIDPELAAHSRQYMYARLFSLLPFYVIMSQKAYLQAAHRMKAVVISTLIVNVLNFALDWALIFGDAGLERLGLPAMGMPALGAAGVGAATSVAATVHALILGIGISRIPAGEGTVKFRKLDPALFRKVFTMGLPISLFLMAEVGLFAATTVLVGWMGARVMAAHQVALCLGSLTFMVPLAVGSATSVQVGRAVGRQDTTGVRGAGGAGLVLGGGAMLVAAALMWTVPETLARIMTSQEEVIPIAVVLIRIAGAFQLFDGLQAVAAGALRGAGMTLWTMWANLVSYWGVGFPVALWLGLGLDYGAAGLWWGLTAGLATAAVILVLRFMHVSRRPIRGIDPS